jgi:hypothetical protein
MKKLTMAAVAGLALIGAGAFAGLTLAGSSGVGEPREVAATVVAHPVTGVPAGGASGRGGGGGRGPTIDFFYARDDIVPEDGSGLVQPLRCPRGAGKPIGGGARTGEGIVIAYLSRAHPATGDTPARTYFIGVEDVDTGAPDPNPGAGALVEIQCAKGMRVRD